MWAILIFAKHRLILQVDNDSFATERQVCLGRALASHNYHKSHITYRTSRGLQILVGFFDSERLSVWLTHKFSNDRLSISVWPVHCSAHRAVSAIRIQLIKSTLAGEGLLSVTCLRQMARDRWPAFDDVTSDYDVNIKLRAKPEIF